MTAKLQNQSQEQPAPAKKAVPGETLSAEDSKKVIAQRIRRQFATRQRLNGLQGDEEHGNYHFSM